MFCCPPELVNKLKKAFMEGRLNPDRLSEITSQERRNLLSEVIGEENAKQVNLLFEQKLLLKNQEKAMYDWASQITGMSAEAKAKTLEKIRQTFADKTTRLYDPKENEKFLNELTSDIYSRKYKTEVSLEEAQTITELSQDTKQARDKMNPDFTWNTRQDGLDFGAAKRASDNYISQLKIEANKVNISELLGAFKEKGIVAKTQAIIDLAKTSFNFIAENSRAIVASVDDSLWFRQGMRALMDPRTSKIWVKDFATSWVDIYKTMRGKIGGGGTVKDIFLGRDAIRAGDAVQDTVVAEGYSRTNYLNGRYEANVPDGGTKGTKLDIGTGEEAYPTSFPSKIPILGRFFKGSEVAYEAGAMRLRMDIADKLYSIVEKTGADMTSNKTIGDINEVVNGMTGRGSFGRRAGGVEKSVNKAFFSIKLFKSNFDYLTLHQGRLSTPATKLAATNLLYTVATTGIILQIAKTLNPNDNRDIFNNTSSNFGKIRNGNMTIDLTHGAGGIVVAISRIILQQSTSATTGITTKLGEGYGSQTGMDVLWNFTENKFSPMFSVLRDIIRQQTFARQRPTILGEAGALTTPISIQNISQFKDETIVKRIIGLIADGLGLNVNVYAPTTDWSQNTGAEIQAFKKKVGDIKFKEANDKFNQDVSKWISDVKNTQKFQTLSEEDKQKVITNKKAELKDKIFKQYGFKYKAPETKKLPKF